MGDRDLKRMREFGIVGRGRVSRHLAFYLESLGNRCTVWSRAEPNPRVADASTILLAVSDAALPTLLTSLASYHGLRLDPARCVHLSGATVVDGIAGFHPLMTFGPELYSLDEYRRIPFVGERESPSFDTFFPNLPNPRFTIPRNEKARYHAECVMAGNHATLLWQGFHHYLQRAGIPLDSARPYLTRVLENFLAHPESSLTGPLKRGDQATLDRNLDSLRGSPERARLYQAFVDWGRAEFGLPGKDSSHA